MGRPCRRAACRPLAGAHRLYDRFVYRRTPPQLAVHTRHRAGLLLSPFPQHRAERVAHRALRVVCYRCGSALWSGAWHHNRRRMV